MYYVARQDGVNVRRIVYRGGDNLSPSASFYLDAFNVLVGGVIGFDASGSFDADHTVEELTFIWDFGDGSPDETGKLVSHQYHAVGIYQVTLTVVDPEGALSQASKDISVGAPPTVEILSPAEGTTFAGKCRARSSLNFGRASCAVPVLTPVASFRPFWRLQWVTS